MSKSSSSGGKGKRRRINANRKAAFLSYKTRDTAAINKLVKVERHKKKHPNDKQKVGIVPDYKPFKGTPEEVAKYKIDQAWKHYLKHG
jgi:hypothetical protein